MTTWKEKDGQEMQRNAGEKRKGIKTRKRIYEKKEKLLSHLKFSRKFM